MEVELRCVTSRAFRYTIFLHKQRESQNRTSQNNRNHSRRTEKAMNTYQSETLSQNQKPSQIKPEPFHISFDSIMTRSIKGSRCHHHGRRRGSCGDGSFNEKYGFSNTVRSINVSFQPIPREMELESIYDDEDEDNISLDFSEEDDDYPKNDSLQTSLRSTGISIHSLPREIELKEEEEDNMSFHWADLQREELDSRMPPTMWDLQTSLRSMDAGIWSLPREVELGSQEEPNCERSYKYAASRTSFVRRRSSCSSSVLSSSVPQKQGLKCQDLVIDELVESMAGKLLICERCSNMHVNELPRAA